MEETVNAKTVRNRVDRTRRRLRFRRVGLMTLAIACTVATWLAGLFLVDLILQPPLSWRIAILTAATAFAAYCLYRYANPVSASTEEAAEEVERQQPEFQGILLSALELDQSLAVGEEVGSRAIVHSFLRRAEKQAERIVPATAVPYHKLLQRAIRTLPFVLVALLVLGWSPSRTAVFLERVFGMSGREYPPKTVVLSVQPGDASCIEGDSVKFVAEPGGVIPNSGRLDLAYADGSTESIELVRTDNRFGSLPLTLEDSVKYHVQLGEAVSRQYSIRLIRHPRLRFELHAAPPEYTGKPRQSVSDNEGSFIAGTVVRVEVRSSKDLDSVQMASKDGKLTPHRLDARRYEAELTLLDDVKLAVKVVDADGLSAAGEIALEAVHDSPPLIILNDGESEMAVLPNAEISLPYHAADDLGLGQMKAYGAFDQDGQIESADKLDVLRQGVLLATVPFAGQTHANGNLPLDLQSVLRKPGDRFVVHAEATDNSPPGQSTRSDSVTIRVIDAAEAGEIQEAWTDDLQERLEEIQQEADQGRLHARNREWAEASRVQNDCTQDLAELEEHVKRSATQLEQAQQQSEDARRQAQVAQRIQAARETSAQAGDHLQEAVEQSAQSQEGVPQSEQDRIGELQQTLSKNLQQAGALADPEEASAEIRNRTQDLIRACSELPSMPDDLAARPQVTEDRAEFWAERKQDVQSLQQEIAKAEQEGIGAAAPWVSQLGQTMQQSGLSNNADQAEQSLRRLATPKAREAEGRIAQTVQQMEDLLPDASEQPATRREETPSARLEGLIRDQKDLHEKTGADQSSFLLSHRSLAEEQEALTDRIDSLRFELEAADRSAAVHVDQAQADSFDAERSLYASDPDQSGASQQAVVESLQAALASLRLQPPPNPNVAANGNQSQPNAPNEKPSAEQLLEQAAGLEDLVREVEKTHAQQIALKDAMEAEQSPSPRQKLQWETSQEETSGDVQRLREPVSAQDQQAGRAMALAAKASEQAHQLLEKEEFSQAREHQEVSGHNLEKAVRSLSSRLDRSLQQCEQRASQEEKDAQESHNQVSQLRKKQEQAAQSQSPSPEQQSQISKECEKLSKESERSGDNQTAQDLRQSQQASQQAEQAMKQGNKQQARTAQAEAARKMGSAERNATQKQSQAADARRQAAQKGQASQQRQQMRQMAQSQQNCCRSGASSGSESAAQQQESTAGKAQAMGKQLGQGEAKNQLQEAAAAAQAAARAIRQNDDAKARSALASSAKAFRAALEAASSSERNPENDPQSTTPGSISKQHWDVTLPPEMEERVSAFFESPKPRRYSDQLTRYITQFKLNQQRSADGPRNGEADD